MQMTPCRGAGALLRPLGWPDQAVLPVLFSSGWVAQHAEAAANPKRRRTLPKTDPNSRALRRTPRRGRSRRASYRLARFWRLRGGEKGRKRGKTRGFGGFRILPSVLPPFLAPPPSTMLPAGAPLIRSAWRSSGRAPGGQKGGTTAAPVQCKLCCRAAVKPLIIFE